VLHLLWHVTLVYTVYSEGPATTSHGGIRTHDVKIIKCRSNHSVPRGRLNTLTMSKSFEWYVEGLWYFTWVFLETRFVLFLVGTNRFDLMTLTFVLLIENFSDGYIFCIVCARPLIFHMSVPYDKIFPWVPIGLT
jgi:hypothetical protein